MAYNVGSFPKCGSFLLLLNMPACTVSVGFFEDMWIPLIHLPQPCALYAFLLFIPLHNIALLTFLKIGVVRPSDPNERAYFWLPGSEATSTHELLDSPEAERLYIDQGEIVRVRVERDEFCDDEPGPPKASEGVLISGQARRVPYTITVSSRSCSLVLSRMARAELRIDIAPLVFHRRTGPRTNSMVEDCRNHDGRKMTRFVLHNENASIFDTSSQMQPGEIREKTNTQARNLFSSMSPQIVYS